jgi:hypothetical protein
LAGKWPFWGHSHSNSHKSSLKRHLALAAYTWGRLTSVFYCFFEIMCLLALHTSGPRDVPQCGAMSLLQKTPHYRWDPAETAARLNAKLWTSVTGGGGGGDGGDWWHLSPVSRPILYTELKADEERTVRGSFAVDGLCFCTSHLAARCPARVARCPRPCPRPRHDRACLIYYSLLSFF